MDRESIYLALLFLATGAGLFSIGCRSADEGPRPFVMPVRPVINVPPTRSTNGVPSDLIPSNSTDPTKGMGRMPKPMAQQRLMNSALSRQSN